MTSLARQLQAIRSDVTATLDKRKHEKVASLLFEPKEAAYQQWDLVYAVGQNGLEGLIQLDPKYQKFESTLFSTSSKDVDRAILTKKDNENWDVVNNEFLDLVAPHALTREAAKALEWLVRRFKIHLFPATAETILFTLLPYHTENLFVRFVQIVALNEKFSFLSQYTDLRAAASLPPPPRQLFIRALSKDPSFLETYFEFVVSRVKHGNGYAAMIKTWSGLTIEAILQMRQSRIPDETIVSRIMPFIAQGLQLRDSAEFQVACYMVLTVLASKRTLASNVIDAAMDAICQGWTEESRRAALMCLITLAQCRQGETAFTDFSIQSLFSLKNLLSLMQNLPSNITSEGLLLPMTQKLLAAKSVSQDQLMLLTVILYSEQVVASERHAVIQSATKQYSKATQSTKPVIGQWLTSLAKEHPDDVKLAIAPLQDTLEPKAISELETLTQLTLTASEDVEMKDAETVEEDVVDAIVDSWSFLPDELSSPSVFINSADTTAVLNLFQYIAQSNDQSQLDKLLSYPMLRKSPVTLPSLFSRIWTTISYSLPVRQLALTQFKSHITSAPASQDFQGFIPHILAGLSDSSDGIRVAAASVVKAMHDRYTKSSTKSTPVGLADLYPEEEGSGGLKWLSLPEAKWFEGEILMPKLPECEIDSNYVIRLVGGLLNGAGKKGKKEQNPTAVMVFLASHVVCSGYTCLQYSLLRILNDYTIENSAALKLKAQSLEQVLIQCKDAQYVSNLLRQETHIDANEFKRLIVQIVGPASSAAQVALILDLVRSQGPLASFACQQLVVVFPSTSQSTQLQIAKLLLSQLESGPSGLAKVASSTLAALSLPTTIILSLMDDIKVEVDVTDSSPARKRQRTDSARSSPGTVPESLLQSTRRLTLLLEVFEKQNPEQHIPVIAPLFAMLDRLIAVETDTRSSLNYPKQMILSCLISIVKGLKGTPTAADPNSFRIDTLIACVRTSTNPQVHNRALLLLAALAQVVPDLILNHVMPIFTFMGASVLRQDDEYSAHVIEQTIKSVVPMLVSGSTGQAEVITPIISAFVTNFDFIPRHRRLSLFKVLLETLGPDQHFPTVLMLLAEKGCQANERNKVSVTEFGVDLLNSFPLKTRLTTIDSFLQLVIRIPRAPAADVDGLPVDVKSYTAEQLGELTRGCLRIIASEVEGRSFQSNVGHVFVTGDVSFLQNDFFSPIVENLLLLASTLTKEVKNDFAESEILINQSLDSILSALPLQIVANIVENFLKSRSDVEITGHIIAIATDRLSRDTTSELTLKSALTLLLKSLQEIITSAEHEEASAFALECVAKLSRAHGKAELPMFEEIVPAVIQQGIASESKLVKEASIDCLHSMLPVLGARVLPFLPEVMPIVLDELELLESAAPDCQRSIFVLLTGFYERIPNFVASYVARVTQIIVSGRFSRFLEAQTALIEAITKNVDTEVCVEALTESWPLVEHDRPMLEIFVTILEQVIVEGSREDLTSSARSLFNLFLNLFDIRSEDKLKPKALKKLEARLNDVFLKLVMKLNDTTFRPLFIELRDWTFRNVAAERKLNRQLFFYTFINKFVDVLQTVVTAYYGIILDDTVQLLNDFVVGTVQSKELWSVVINSLQKSFHHDLAQDSYWSSPTRFDKIILPLLSQLTLPFKSSAAIHAIVSLASKAHSEESCKVINDTLMEYMRSDTASIRLAAVNTQRHLYSEITHEWLKMLPPTVPIISEVMEDEDDNVIEAAHELIQTIEKVGGISMQKLLT